MAKEIYHYNKNYCQLKNNNILKTSRTAPFYYRELTHYIKTQNPKRPNIKNETKTIYKNILEKGSQDNIVFEEQKWKEKIISLDFTKT